MNFCLLLQTWLNKIDLLIVLGRFNNFHFTALKKRSPIFHQNKVIKRANFGHNFFARSESRRISFDTETDSGSQYNTHLSKDLYIFPFLSAAWRLTKLCLSLTLHPLSGSSFIIALAIFTVELFPPPAFLLPFLVPCATKNIIFCSQSASFPSQSSFYFPNWTKRKRIEYHFFSLFFICFF